GRPTTRSTSVGRRPVGTPSGRTERAQFTAIGTKLPSRPNRPGGSAFTHDFALHQRDIMTQRSTTATDFNRALGDAKKQASGVAVPDAAQDVYGQARDSAADVMDAATAAAQNTAGSFERALRNMIEQQPYTAVAIALGVGWLLGRMHRPL